MRMEELSNSQYIKSTDTVERYLLGLVEQYFKHSNIAATTSREYIIKKAVERMQEELSFESIGVLSITLPSGEVRTGAISISLEDLGGEPAISPKLSAFNVPFGTEQNTACEGNDPRLSDKRYPLTHKHEISEIVGLEGVLSSLTGKLERMTGFVHEHTNKNILDMITYTGSNTSIDLNILDTLDDNLTVIVDGIRQDITQYRQDVDNAVAQVESDITSVRQQIDDARNYVLTTNQEYYAQSKQYTDDMVDAAVTSIRAEMNNLTPRTFEAQMLSVANKVTTNAGTMEFNVSDVLSSSMTSVSQHGEIDIDPAILNIVDTRRCNLHECQIELYIEYTDPMSGKIVRGTLPYIYCNSNQIAGSLQVSIKYVDKKIGLTYNTEQNSVPSDIMEARIICIISCPETM